MKEASETLTETAEAPTEEPTDPKVPSLEEFIFNNGPSLREEAARLGINYHELGRQKYTVAFPALLASPEVKRMRKLQDTAAKAEADRLKAEERVREITEEWDELLANRADLQNKVQILEARIHRLTQINIDEHYQECAMKIAKDEFAMGENQEMGWLIGLAMERRKEHLPRALETVCAELAALEAKMETFRAKHSAK